MISDDLSHDKYAVKKFEELSLQFLKSKGINPKYIVVFSDNCKSQYKGKGTFQFHSQSEVPIMHMFLVQGMAKVLLMELLVESSMQPCKL